MPAEENKAVIRRLVEEAWNKGNLDVLGEIIAPNHVHHDRATPGLHTGPEGERQLITTYRAAFPDMQLRLDDLVAEGDKVVHRWTVRATHQGPLMGIPPTGKRIEVAGISIDRLANGKIVESWVAWDSLGLLQQFGAVPRAA